MLGSHYDPFLIEKDPSQQNFRVDELDVRRQMNADRYRRRKSLLSQLDAGLRRIEETAAIDQMDTYFQRAFYY